MQMVSAKCIMPAWDSVNCLHLKPGQGSLPGGLFEIDRDGPLAKLKTSGGPMGKYVFEFDRNGNPDDKVHDYTCKKCGETKDPLGRKFTLNTLGTHTKTAHKDESTAESSEDVVVAVDGRGKHKNKSFKCSQCDEKFPHLYALKVHKKTHAVAVAA